MADAAASWLTVRRTSDEDIRERELYVSLNGQRLGILTYGDVATVPIAPGRHELRVHNTLWPKKAVFDATPGQHVRFRAVFLPGKGFAYWAFFLGAALMGTGLEREEDGPPATRPEERPFRH
jgi:hypothetical protein